MVLSRTKTRSFRAWSSTAPRAESLWPARRSFCAGKDNEFSVVAKTTTGQDGSFSFPGSSLGTRGLSPDVVYLPGANRQGIHYPGPRLRLDSGRSPARVQLTAYDAVASPCPLVAEELSIDIQVNPGVLDVTEVLLISNPSSTTYVGSTDSDMPPTTLSLSIPEGVSHVTFNQEFDGRNFRLVDGRLVTSVPWTPGKRQLAFVYQLPVEHSQLLFSRPLDLPTSRVRLAVGGKCSDATACNLPRITDRGQLPIAFASTGQPLPAGYVIQLQVPHLSVSWLVNARWLAVILLGSLLAATAGLTFRRNRCARQPVQTGPRGRYFARSPARR